MDGGTLKHRVAIQLLALDTRLLQWPLGYQCKDTMMATWLDTRSGLTSKRLIQRPKFESTEPQHKFGYFLSLKCHLIQIWKPIKMFFQLRTTRADKEKTLGQPPGKSIFGKTNRHPSKLLHHQKKVFIPVIVISNVILLLHRMIENGPMLAIYERIKTKFSNYIVNYLLLLSYPRNLVHFTAIKVVNWKQKISYVRKGLMMLRVKSLRKKEFSMKHLLSVINVNLYLLPKYRVRFYNFIFSHIFAPMLFPSHLRRLDFHVLLMHLCTYL